MTDENKDLVDAKPKKARKTKQNEVKDEKSIKQSKKLVKSKDAEVLPTITVPDLGPESDIAGTNLDVGDTGVETRSVPSGEEVQEGLSQEASQEPIKEKEVKKVVKKPRGAPQINARYEFWRGRR